ncbi:hypothetical protein ACOMHN_040906 [Nucella lapillus]
MADPPSPPPPEERRFQTWDYILFALVLAISASIGIFYACHGKKQKTTTEFLMADRNMSIVPIAVSILVSFMSAILILGTPAEMYTAGTEFVVHLVGLLLAVLISALVFVPLLYPLKLTSSFEYLERRFKSRAAKLTGTLMMVVQQVFYMGIASYAPSTALEAVTGFPEWATIVIVGLVSTFYTTLGGMKAVVWTDTFQAIVMTAGLLAVVIEGVIQVGDFSTIWEINEIWNRTNFINFDPDPTLRQSFWSLVVGMTVSWTATYGVNQASVQRYCALPSLTKATVSVLLNIPGLMVLVLVACMAGVVIFAYYAKLGCDPYTSGRIANSNQIIPHFVTEVLNYPGLPGLFISSLFSGALSTMSSSLNALAAVSWEDFLKPVLGKRLTEPQKTTVTKLLVLSYGAAGTGMAFIASSLGGTVLQAAVSFTGASSGPILGLFLLGGLFPWANRYGAVVGGVLGLALPLWISIGAYSLPRPPYSLSFPTNGCLPLNTTTTTTTTTDTTSTVVMMTTSLSQSVEASHEVTGIQRLYTVSYLWYSSFVGPLSPLTGIQRLYTVSYLWYSSIGVATVIIVGLLDIKPDGDSSQLYVPPPKDNPPAYNPALNDSVVSVSGNRRGSLSSLDTGCPNSDHPLQHEPQEETMTKRADLLSTRF